MLTPQSPTKYNKNQTKKNPNLILNLIKEKLVWTKDTFRDMNNKNKDLKQLNDCKKFSIGDIKQNEDKLLPIKSTKFSQYTEDDLNNISD